MALHCVWNTASTISGFLFVLMLPLWLLFVVAFLGILIWLVVRKGRIIRAHLQDEVLLGNLTREELELVCSPFGRLRAGLAWGGSAGRRFVRAAARLGLCKWHAGRAMKGRQRTVSIDWIVPLRQELFELRNAMAQAIGRPLPQPRAWVPGVAGVAGGPQPQATAQAQWQPPRPPYPPYPR
jgi:hypothetical protein